MFSCISGTEENV